MNPPSPPPEKKADTLKSLLAKPATIERLQAIAPKYLNPERLMKVLLLTVSRDFKLMRCTPQSLLASLMRCAQFGLEPDGRLVHLIPYGDEVQVIVDWKGLVEIARRNGIEAKAILVFEKDDFRFLEDDGLGKCFLTHTIDHRQDRGKLLGAYSRSRRADGVGSIDYEWMSLAEIEAIRKRSQAKDKGPWVTDFNEMARKTVLRRHSKRWPLSAEDRGATEDDDTPEEIRSRVSVETVEQPRKPLFAPRSISEGEEEDDVSYAMQPEPVLDSQPEPPKPERKAKSKVESKPVEPPKAEATDPNLVPDKSPNEPSLRDRLREFVEADNETTFEVFKAIIVDLGYIPEAQTWTTYKDIDDIQAAKLLNAHRGLAQAIKAKKAEGK